MSDAVRFPLVLGIVSVIAAAVLAYLYGVTKPEIDKRQKEKDALAEKIALPDAVSTEAKGAYKEGRDAEGKLVGYLARGAAYGYSSEIAVLVGIRPDLRIASIQVLSEKETPGLGTRIEEAPVRETWTDRLAGIFGRRAQAAQASSEPDRALFQVQFDGLSKDDLRLARDGGKIQAISGATITSKAVLAAVQQAVAAVEEALSPRQGS